MCDRLILNGAAYICERCWGELLVHKESWPTAMTAAQVRDAIEEFMLHPPGYTILLSGPDLEEEFKRLTGDYPQ